MEPGGLTGRWKGPLPSASCLGHNTKVMEHARNRLAVATRALRKEGWEHVPNPSFFCALD